MEIKELYIKNFGKFSDKHLVLEKGIHVFYGENEYGKSTIFAFIKAMLFGLERARGRAAQNDEFSRYEPWHNPNYYAGVMRFTSGGKTFRLERCFDRYAKSASLVCEDDGEELSVADKDLEMLMGGMSKELFENTIAIGQLSARPGQGLYEELKNYAANFYETGSSTLDLNGALESLRTSRKSVEQEIKELGKRQQEKKSALYQRCEFVADDAARLQKELEENQEKLNTLHKDYGQGFDGAAGETDGRQIAKFCDKNTEERAERNIEGRAKGNKEGRAEGNKEGRAEGNTERRTEGNTGGRRERRTMPVKIFISTGILLLLTGNAGLSFIAAAASRWWPAFGSAVSVISWLLIGAGFILCAAAGINYFVACKKDNSIQGGLNRAAGKLGGRKDRGSVNSDEGINKSGDNQKERQRLEWENQRIKAQWKEQQVKYQNLQEQIEETEGPSEKSKNLQKTRQAYLLAEEKLLEAAGNVARGFGSILNRSASEILSQITAGRYTRLLIDGQFTMTLLEEGRRIPLERVSRGTIEQVYFALRMAAANILCQEPVPLILDEAFAYYDEKRLKAAIKWLSLQKRQVIIFSCQRREQNMISKVND